jgi:hypothetical protein
VKIPALASKSMMRRERSRRQKALSIVLSSGDVATAEEK